MAFRGRWEWASLRKVSIELLCVRFMGHVPNARRPRRGRVVKQYVDATAAGYFAVVAIPLDPFPDRGILSLKRCQLLKGAGVGYDRQSNIGLGVHVAEEILPVLPISRPSSLDRKSTR